MGYCGGRLTRLITLFPREFISWFFFQSPAPAPLVKEMNDAGQFYTNRVLKDWKEKSKVHVEWTRAWVSTLQELQAFVKEHHTTGLVWNPKGVDAKSVAKPATNGSTPGGPPPPPPPPPPGLFDDVPSGDPKDQARNQLFADINKGSDITKGKGFSILSRIKFDTL